MYSNAPQRGAKSRQLFLFYMGVPIAVLAAALSTNGQDPVVKDTGPVPAVSQQELVHRGDLIDVDVVGGFEFDWRGTITPEGYLEGFDAFEAPIFALCRTEKAIADDIAAAYGKFLRDPVVVVRIIDRSNRAVARVLGAVRTPTRFGIRRPVTLRELIVLSGGIASGASGDISIFRPKDLNCQPSGLASDNGSQTTNIKISDLLGGKDSADPVILSGDIVTVGKAFPVYVIGAVNAPVPIYLTSDLSVSRAIATAGGPSKDADGTVVSIFRRSGNEMTALEVDLAKIKSGQSEDEILKPFDIIDIPLKGGKRKYPPAEAALQDRTVSISEMPLKIVD